MNGFGMDIAFWIFAAVSVISALGVLALGNVFRAALLLVLCFFAVAGLYVTLSADFLAAVQVLLYIGAIAVLLLFAIMITTDVTRGSPVGKMTPAATFVGVLLLAAMVLIIVFTPWRVSTAVPAGPSTTGIATRLFSPDGFVLPFEIASLLLLAAVIGAIVLVREK